MNSLFLYFFFISFYAFEIISQGQPGCSDARYAFRFYEHHSRIEETKICKESFDSLVDVCIRLYQKLRSRKVKTDRKMVRHAESVARTCEKRKMTFWREDNSSTVPEARTNVSLDVDLFRCPLTKMNLEFAEGSGIDLALEDFYISEGIDLITFGILRNSTSTDNICLTNLYKLKLSTDPIDEYLEQMKFIKPNDTS